MLLKEKINLPKYIILSLAATLIFLGFSYGDRRLIYVILSVYLATLINQALLVALIWSIIFTDTPKTRALRIKRLIKITSYLLSKVIILVLAIIAGVHFVGDKIIIALLNYIVQIVLLGLCLRRKA